MTLSVRQITQIAHAVAGKARRAEVQGVLSSNGGSERVELLVRISHPQHEPRLVLLNVSREGSAPFEQEFTAKLQDLF